MHLLFSLAQVVFHCHQCLYMIYLCQVLYIYWMFQLKHPPGFSSSSTFLFCTVLSVNTSVEHVCAFSKFWETWQIPMHKTARKLVHSYELKKLCSVHVLIHGFHASSLRYCGNMQSTLSYIFCINHFNILFICNSSKLISQLYFFVNPTFFTVLTLQCFPAWCNCIFYNKNRSKPFGITLMTQ